MDNVVKSCRNCGGTELYILETSRTVPIQLLARPPKFQLLVCGSCGIVDWFLAGKDLEKLKKNFVRQQD
jgi:hypothetical protein